MTTKKIEAPALPAKIKAGWLDYEVREWQPRDATSRGRYGETRHTLGHINIDLQHGGRQTAETLLHEVLHVVWRLMNIDDDSDAEERRVCSVSNGLATIIRDNPELMAYIQHHLTHGN